MKAGVVKETAPGERRVALVPDAVARLRTAGIEVLVERGAGDGAWLSDVAYAEAGATIVSAAELYRDGRRHPHGDQADDAAARQAAARGQAVIGMLAPLVDPELAAALAGQGVTAISLDRMPRTLTRTQPMDALVVPGQRGRLQGGAGRGRASSAGSSRC